jgi:hypothetical protein
MNKHTTKHSKSLPELNAKCFELTVGAEAYPYHMAGYFLAHRA